MIPATIVLHGPGTGPTWEQIRQAWPNGAPDMECPRCGNQNVTFFGGMGPDYRVGCSNCYYNGPGNHVEEEVDIMETLQEMKRRFAEKFGYYDGGAAYFPDAPHTQEEEDFVCEMFLRMWDETGGTPPKEE